MNRKKQQDEDGFQAIRFDGRRLHLLDQRCLPAEERWLQLETVDEAISAIRELVVRGRLRLALPPPMRQCLRRCGVAQT